MYINIYIIDKKLERIEEFCKCDATKWKSIFTNPRDGNQIPLRIYWSASAESLPEKPSLTWVAAPYFLFLTRSVLS